jgi:hypothetical protein
MAWLGLSEWFWSQATAPEATAAIALGLGALAVVSVILLTLHERRGGAFLLLGSLLSLLPLLAAKPSWRLLGVPMIGVLGVLAQVVTAPRRVRLPLEGPLWLIACLILGYSHLVRGPVATAAMMRRATRAADAFQLKVDDLRARLHDPNETVVLARADAPPLVLWGPFMLHVAAPPPWRVLSFQSGPLTVARTGPNSVEVASVGAPLFPSGPDDFFRGPGSAMRLNDTVRLSGTTITVTEVDGDSAPVRVRVEFPVDLDDAHTAWIAEEHGGLREMTVPPVGAMVRLGRD